MSSYNVIPYTLLSASTELTDIVGATGGIRPVFFPEDQVFPAVCFTKHIDPVPVKVHGKNKSERIEYIFYCVAQVAAGIVSTSAAEEADSIAREVRATLDGVGKVTVGPFTISLITFEEQGHEIVDEKYRLVIIPVKYKMSIAL